MHGECDELPMNTSFKKLADALRAGEGQLPPVVVGFDGFVDEMITAVGERRSLSDFAPVPTIGEFGRLIGQSAGHSSLREIVVNAMHPGGCAVNMGDGLASLGVPVDCFATLGEPVHAAFAEVAAKFHGCHSWGATPGRTLAFEFNDGKLMFSAVAPLADFTPEYVMGRLANGAYAKACAGAKVIALTDWTLYPHMTGVWRLLQREVYATLRHRPSFFIDLVDPSTRLPEDIRAMAETLHGFEATGPLTLGLNGNEANLLAGVLGIAQAGDDAGDAGRLAGALRERLEIAEVVIHQMRFAVSASAAGCAMVSTAFCPNPKKSTGAGDRFNAGFALGILLEMDAGARLTLGCAASSFFVRNARSAGMTELADFIDNVFAEAAGAK